MSALTYTVTKNSTKHTILHHAQASCL